MTSPLPPEHLSPGRTDTEPPRRKADPWAIAMGIVGGVLLGTGLTFAILGYMGIFEEPTPPTIPPAPTLTVPAASPPPTFTDEVSAAAVAARVAPSTVAVEIGSFLLDGSGSGVVYGSDGYVITNDHVVSGAQDIFVVFNDGGRFPATVVGTDPVTDIAVLLVDRADLTPVEIGSADVLSIGDRAVAIGNPLGLAGGPTVTSGIVSALDRSLIGTGGADLYGLVQTDAPIAPGSSGGALADAGGRLIGITTAIAVSDVGSVDLGFAVPVEIALGVANDLISDGVVRHALLGITGDTAWAEENGAEFPVGILVEEVTAGGGYDLAGGQINDVIVEVDGHPVNTLDALLARLRRLREGQLIPVRILRADANTTLDVTLGLLP